MGVKVDCKTTIHITDLYLVEDDIPKRLLSKIAYGVYCTNYMDFYESKTIRQLGKHFKDHLDVKYPSSVTNRVIDCGHQFDFDWMSKCLVMVAPIWKYLSRRL